MTSITDLPNEILDRIISFIDNSPSSLSALSQICKKLSRPARKALNSHVCLEWKLNKHSQVLRFAAGNNGNDHVESIRIRPQASQLNAFHLGMSKAFGQVDGLCTCLSSLPKLSTFSLRVDCASERNRAVERQLLPERAIVKIIMALPPTVVNLELDTARLDGIWNSDFETGEAHLCHAISDMLPQLETLYLQVSSICAGIFQSVRNHTKAKQPQTKLRCAAIKLSEKPEQWSYTARFMPTSSTNCVNGDRFGKKLLSAKNLCRHIFDLQAAGVFPELERFILFSIPKTAARGIGQLRIHDVASRSMMQCPFRETRRTNATGEVIEYSIFPFSKEQLTHIFRVPGDGSENDFFGRFGDIESALLHEVLWTESNNGNRSPPKGRISKNGLSVDTRSLVGKDIVESHAEAQESRVWHQVSSLRVKPEQIELRACMQQFEQDYVWEDEPDVSRAPHSGFLSYAEDL